MALDVALLMQTEIGEVFEPFVKGRGSSSTMPQKRNPISSELIIASAKSVRQDVGLMLDSLAGADHERATGPWHLEWLALPRAFITTAGALYQARFMTSGLIVDTDRMKKNLDMTGGLIVAEAVMMGLAKHIGRNAAHDLVYSACRAALDKSTPLIDQLRLLPDVTKVLEPAALNALVDPANYLGTSDAMIDRVLSGHHA
jgi:3-carboxy-cis,cis-muconate cycloisomerase